MSREPMQPRFVEVDYDPFGSDELARSVPTTESQRELWLAARMGTDASLAYNESVSLRIEGRLDAAALQNALLALSDRHEALRATVDADGAHLMVAPRGALQATSRDLSALSPQDALEQAAAARHRAVTEPFDLLAGPLCRAELLRFSDDRHELILTSHHVVCDGWSFGVLCTELMALYRELVEPGAADAPLPTPDSFCDYVLDELGDAGRARADADTRWWLERFDGDVPVLELPLDRPRPPARTFASSREDLPLDPALVSCRVAGRIVHGFYCSFYCAARYGASRDGTSAVQ